MTAPTYSTLPKPLIILVSLGICGRGPQTQSQLKVTEGLGLAITKQDRMEAGVRTEKVKSCLKTREIRKVEGCLATRGGLQELLWVEVVSEQGPRWKICIKMEVRALNTEESVEAKVGILIFKTQKMPMTRKQNRHKREMPNAAAYAES